MWKEKRQRRKKEMMYVCDSVKPHAVWYYEDGTYKNVQKGRVIRKIKGKHLPSPDEIRDRNVSAIQNGRKDKRIEPTPSVVKLWEHWQWQTQQQPTA